MVLPYYLDKSIAENHVYTGHRADLAEVEGSSRWIGRRATALDVKANVCTLDDGTRVGVRRTASSPPAPRQARARCPAPTAAACTRSGRSTKRAAVIARSRPAARW
jgi:hypothetical protein